MDWCILACCQDGGHKASPQGKTDRTPMQMLTEGSLQQAGCSRQQRWPCNCDKHHWRSQDQASPQQAVAIYFPADDCAAA